MYYFNSMYIDCLVATCHQNIVITPKKVVVQKKPIKKQTQNEKSNEKPKNKMIELTKFK